jgi:hypothetical protein
MIIKGGLFVGQWVGRGGKETAEKGEYNQSTLYACIKISQWNPFVLFMLIVFLNV